MTQQLSCYMDTLFLPRILPNKPDRNKCEQCLIIDMFRTLISFQQATTLVWQYSTRLVPIGNTFLKVTSISRLSTLFADAPIPRDNGCRLCVLRTTNTQKMESGFHGSFFPHMQSNVLKNEYSRIGCVNIFSESFFNETQEIVCKKQETRISKFTIAYPVLLLIFSKTKIFQLQLSLSQENDILKDNHVITLNGRNIFYALAM